MKGHANENRSNSQIRPSVALVFVKFNLLVIGVLLSACAPQMEVLPTAPAYQTFSLPPIGERATAQVGETIISMVHTQSLMAIEFLNDCSFSEKFDRPGTGTVEYKVSRGAVYNQSSVTNGVPAYCGKSMEHAIMDVEVEHCVAVSSGNIVAFPNSEMLIKSDCRITAKQTTVEAEDSFKRELLYDGRSGTTIHLSYREFARDMARPAFTQELSYDIKDDRIVGFKGARFEVITANNTKIEYKVLSGF